MGVGLLIGALLARLRRFRGHAWCQSFIVLLNLALIVLTMIPSFRAQVSPKIPLKLAKAYYALAMAHAALGIRQGMPEVTHHCMREWRASMTGFLGSQAGFGADLNLVIQIAMGIALIVGTFLARAKRYRAHGACQAAVLLLNLIMIGVVMWPSFHQQVLPRLPKHFGKRYYAIATFHGMLGAAAELLGLYILLVAGTNVLRRAWRFRRWKLWMRIELALWWAVLLVGIATYCTWYLPHSRP